MCVFTVSLILAPLLRMVAPLFTPRPPVSAPEPDVKCEIPPISKPKNSSPQLKLFQHPRSQTANAKSSRIPNLLQKSRTKVYKHCNKMQAPAMPLRDYVKTAYDMLTSTEKLVDAIRRYPNAPNVQPLYQCIRDAKRDINYRDFEAVRSSIRRGIRLFQGKAFDAQDVVSRTLVKSVYTLLNGIAQNVVDNLISSGSTQLGGMRPHNPQTSTRQSPSRSSVVPNANYEAVRSRVRGSEESVPVPISKLRFKDFGSAKLNHMYSLLEPPTPESGEESADEWTLEDEKNFDHTTYYGEGWHLE